MNRNAGAYQTYKKPGRERHARECTPSFTMETYDRYGRLQKTELLRTLTVAEFMFELERSKLPLIEVKYEHMAHEDFCYG